MVLSGGWNRWEWTVSGSIWPVFLCAVRTGLHCRIHHCPGPSNSLVHSQQCGCSLKPGMLEVYTTWAPSPDSPGPNGTVVTAMLSADSCEVIPVSSVKLPPALAAVAICTLTTVDYPRTALTSSPATTASLFATSSVTTTSTMKRTAKIIGMAPTIT